MREATWDAKNRHDLPETSIHASHEGSDLALAVDSGLKPELQSTLPMREATTLQEFGQWLEQTSIHASHEGSDPPLWYNLTIYKNFNPRFP